jgi:hypothetical protein
VINNSYIHMRNHQSIAQQLLYHNVNMDKAEIEMATNISASQKKKLIIYQVCAWKLSQIRKSINWCDIISTCIHICIWAQRFADISCFPHKNKINYSYPVWHQNVVFSLFKEVCYRKYGSTEFSACVLGYSGMCIHSNIDIKAWGDSSKH